MLERFRSDDGEADDKDVGARVLAQPHGGALVLHGEGNSWLVHGVYKDSWLAGGVFTSCEQSQLVSWWCLTSC